MNIYWGMQKLSILQNWTIWGVWGVMSIHFTAFLKVKVQNGIIFGVAKILNCMG